jgi:hypothetical protein
MFLSSFVLTQTSYLIIRFEVFTAVTMKNGALWDVMPCGSFKNRRFGGTGGIGELVHRFLSP